jgi:hypothetical protein
MNDTQTRDRIGLRVTQAYAGLYLSPKREDGSQVGHIATVGAFDVRLVEMTSANASEQMIIWVELFSRHEQISIDSCSCSELEEAIWAAEYLISLAEELEYEAEVRRKETQNKVKSISNESEYIEYRKRLH